MRELLEEMQRINYYIELHIRACCHENLTKDKKLTEVECMRHDINSLIVANEEYKELVQGLVL